MTSIKTDEITQHLKTFDENNQILYGTIILALNKLANSPVIGALKFATDLLLHIAKIVTQYKVLNDNMIKYLVKELDKE